jgi:hypothetical protein
MRTKFIWIGAFVVAAAVAATLATCRRLPNPMEPTLPSSSSAAPAAHTSIARYGPLS